MEAVFCGAELKLFLGVLNGNQVTLQEPQVIRLKTVTPQAFQESLRACQEMLQRLQAQLGKFARKHPPAPPENMRSMFGLDDNENSPSPEAAPA